MLIVEAERFLLDENIAREPEIALKLEEKVGQLRELLAREPDDRTALKKCTDELREVPSVPGLETRCSFAD